MNISIIVNPIQGGWSPWDIRVGGTEESVIEWAVRLKQRGHVVTCFHNGTHGEFLGVPFVDRSAYLDRTSRGITLNINYPDLPVDEPTVYFNNLTDAATHDFSGFKAIIHPSNYARETLRLDHPDQRIVPHGYDPETIYYDPAEKIPHTVLYASSPDRGLSELEKAWPSVVESVPDAQLIVTYNGQLDTPNTLCLGNISNSDMAELYRTSDVWVHPALGGELFGITAVKAQVAGCWPVYYPTMALTETVKYGTTTNHSDLAPDLISALLGHPEMPRLPFADWEESTTLLEKVLQSCYN